MRLSSINWRIALAGIIALMVGLMANTLLGSPNGHRIAVLEAKLTASDAKSDQWFGYSVSVSGDTVVAGIPWQDAQMNRTGAAYAFVRSSGTWTQQQKLIPSPSECTACHGGTKGYYTAVVNGDTAFIGGAHSRGDTASVFVRSGPTWTAGQQLSRTAYQTVLPHPFPLSISGNTLVMGTSRVADSGYPGRADVYVRPSGACSPGSGTWNYQQLLAPSSCTFCHKPMIWEGPLPVHAPCSICHTRMGWYGHSVAVSNDTAVVGARSTNGANAVFVFVRTSNTWTQQSMLTLPWIGGVAQSRPFPVAISGNTIVVGTSWVGTNWGSAYVFVRNSNVWSQQQILTASDAAQGQLFGHSVAIEDDTLAIGAQGGRAVYLFSRSTGTWMEQQKIVLPTGGAAADDPFPISISGDKIVIGASGDGDKGANAGAAYVYILKPTVDLSLQKSDDVDPVVQYDQITYTLTANNNDPSVAATGVTVTDTLPVGMSYVSASSGCVHSGGTVTCVLGTVQAGTTQTITITVQATASGMVTNHASITADQPDPDAANNAASATTRIDTRPTSSNNSITTNEDVPYIFTLADFPFSDADAGDSLSQVQIISLPAGTLALNSVPVAVNQAILVADLNAGRLTFAPAPNANGTPYSSFQFKVHDGIAYSASAYTMTINVTPVNDPPTISTIGPKTMAWNTSLSVSFTIDDIDTPLNQLTVKQPTSSNHSLLLDSNILSSGTGTNRYLTIIPESDQFGNTTISIPVSDGTDTTLASFILTVVNTPTGSNVQVPAGSGVTVTFTEITAGGQTTVSLIDCSVGNFQVNGQCYEISSTAVYTQGTDKVNVCISFPNPGLTPQQIAALQVCHFESGSWNCLSSTATVDASNVITVCAQVSSLSLFAVIKDTTPPTFDLNRLTSSLWPPDRKMVKAATITDLSDKKDPAPRMDVTVTVKDVTAEKQTTDDSRHEKDWEVRKVGKTWEIWLRADRPDTATQRTYTITATARDKSGNAATKSTTVTVPHNAPVKSTAAPVPEKVPDRGTTAIVSNVPVFATAAANAAAAHDKERL